MDQDRECWAFQPDSRDRLNFARFSFWPLQIGRFCCGTASFDYRKFVSYAAASDTFGQFMKQVRCPYCVEENGFKVMTPRDTHLICLNCGHVVVPDRPTYRCSFGIDSPYRCVHLQDVCKFPIVEVRLWCSTWTWSGNFRTVPVARNCRPQCNGDATRLSRRTRCSSCVRNIRLWSYGFHVSGCRQQPNYIEYPDPRREGWQTKILPAVKKIPIAALIRFSGKSRSMLVRTLAGCSRPRRRNQELLKSILHRLGLI